MQYRRKAARLAVEQQLELNLQRLIESMIPRLPARSRFLYAVPRPTASTDTRVSHQAVYCCSRLEESAESPFDVAVIVGGCHLWIGRKAFATTGDIAIAGHCPFSSANISSSLVKILREPDAQDVSRKSDTYSLSFLNSDSAAVSNWLPIHFIRRFSYGFHNDLPAMENGVWHTLCARSQLLRNCAWKLA